MRDTKTTCSKNFKKLVQTLVQKNVLENLVKKLVREKTCSREPVRKKNCAKNLSKKKLDQKKLVRKKTCSKILVKNLFGPNFSCFFLERFFQSAVIPSQLSAREHTSASTREHAPARAPACAGTRRAKKTEHARCWNFWRGQVSEIPEIWTRPEFVESGTFCSMQTA